VVEMIDSSSSLCSLAIISTHAPSLISFRAPLINGLVSLGHRVFTLAPNFDNSTRSKILAMSAIPVDIPMSRSGINPFTDILNTFKLASILISLKPDIVLGYFVKPVIFGTWAAWLAGVPRRFAMVEGLGFVFSPSVNEISIKKKIAKRLVLFLYRLAFLHVRKIIFLNPDDQAELTAAGILKSSQGFLLGGIGVDLKYHCEAPPMLMPVTFLLVARLLREKGIADYASAARIVKQRYPDTRFILLGGFDGSKRSISESEVVGWMREGILEWHGHVPVKSWMEQSSVFVLPSFYREGVPASIQEALATGRPIITTDLPGCRDTVIDGENGFLVPDRQPGVLADKMCIFIENPHLIAEMGRSSRIIAEKRFNSDEVNGRLIALLLSRSVF
jgi:glycosyltransferase involved in cell wall biosynthesis